MRLVFAGTPEVALPSLRALLDSRHEVAAVVTRPDARAGRGRRLLPSPVAQLAGEHGIEALKPMRPSEPEFLDRLREIAPDCCPVVAYGGLLRREALDIPPVGWVNLHFSVLPAWRGAAPVQHALLAGDEITGASTFRLVEELDAGPVYGVLTERIRTDDTAGTLLDRLAVHGAELLVRTVDGIADGRLEARDQPAEGVTLAPKVTVEDARIDWSQTASAVDRRVRACTPEPGAWTTFRGERFKVQGVRVVAETDSLPAGAIAADKRAVLVGTGTQPVELIDVQPAGKQRMEATAWARGVRLDDGEHLGSEA
jgi:methionyl-tRNA formyltransferase